MTNDSQTQPPSAADIVSKIREALEQIERLEKRADDSMGFVDNPHTKALRQACKMVRDALAEAYDQLWHLANHKDSNSWLKELLAALVALDALIARMEQNTGSDVGIAGDASTRKDEENSQQFSATSAEPTTASSPDAAGKPQRHCEAASAPQITNPAQLGDGRNTAPAAFSITSIAMNIANEIMPFTSQIGHAVIAQLIDAQLRINGAHFNAPAGEKKE